MHSHEPRYTLTRVPVDSVDALGSVPARIAVTLVHVNLTIRTGRSRLTAASVSSNQVLTVPSKLTRVRLALVDLNLAQVPGVARIALARKRIVPVDTGAPVARIRSAVVDVRLAGHPRIAGWALARVPGNRIVTDAPISTRLRQTIVDVDLAAQPGESDRAGTLERVDQIPADATVQTRVRGALVDVDLALRSGESWNVGEMAGVSFDSLLWVFGTVIHLTILERRKKVKFSW